MKRMALAMTTLALLLLSSFVGYAEGVQDAAAYEAWMDVAFND